MRGDPVVRRAVSVLLLAVLGSAPGAAAEELPAGSRLLDAALAAGSSHLEAGHLERADVAFGAALVLARICSRPDREVSALTGRLRVASASGDALGASEIGIRLAEAEATLGRAWAARRTESDVAWFSLLAGRPTEALDRATDLLERARRSRDVEIVVSAQEIRAHALATLFDYPGAVAAAKDAVAQAAPLPDVEERARALQTLAATWMEVGAVDRAERLHDEVLRDLPEGDSGTRADALGNLGFLLYWQRRLPDLAIQPLRRAIEMHERLGNVGGAALGRVHLATALLLAGNVEEAAKESDAALDRAAGDPVLGGYALTVRTQVRLKEGGGAAEALGACDEALRRAAATGSRGLEFEARRMRAEALLASGDARAAMEEARQAILLADRIDLELPDEQAAQVRNNFRAAFDVGVRAGVAEGAPERIAEFLERGRAGALLSTLAGREAAWSATTSAAARRAEQRARSRVAEADRRYRIALASQEAARAEESDEPSRRAAEQVQAAREILDAAHAAYVDATEAVEGEARLATPGNRSAVAALGRMQSELLPGEALVLYTVATDPIGALVVLPGAARWVPLRPRGDLPDLLARANVYAADETAASDLAYLREALLDPLGIPKDVRRLLVSPEGALAKVPFPALVLDRDVDMALVPSGSVWSWLRRDGALRGRGVLAVGNPDYSIPRDAASVEVYGAPAVPGLAGTDEELRRIAGGPDDIVLSGRSASEPRLREVAAKRDRWSLAYFACHGVVDPDHPARSALVLSPEASDDGYLAVHEVFRMRLRADLVVLAACESALGSAIDAEGLYGLPRAFLCAGAARVVGSLWRVDDVATRALMLEFARARAGGAGAAAALRAAQRAVRGDPRWAHPRFWAAWVLWGLPE